MSLLLAMAAQAGILDAAPAKAARACARAIAYGNADIQRLTSQMTYFTMQAARADPGTEPFLARVKTLMAEINTAELPGAETGQALLVECDRRFPKARSLAPVRLPADSFKRDLLCLGVVGIAAGAAEGIEEDGGDARERQRLTATLDGYTRRLTNARLAEHAIATDDQITLALGEALKASLDEGNIETIERACTAALAS